MADNCKASAQDSLGERPHGCCWAHNCRRVGRFLDETRAEASMVNAHPACGGVERIGICRNHDGICRERDHAVHGIGQCHLARPNRLCEARTSHDHSDCGCSDELWYSNQDNVVKALVLVPERIELTKFKTKQITCSGSWDPKEAVKNIVRSTNGDAGKHAKLPVAS